MCSEGSSGQVQQQKIQQDEQRDQRELRQCCGGPGACGQLYQLSAGTGETIFQHHQKIFLLVQDVELTDEFKANYEKWLEKEVYNTQIEWDSLLVPSYQ